MPRPLHNAVLMAICLLFTSAKGFAAQTQELLEDFATRVEALRADLISVRRDIHRHPEVSGEEERTAAIVAERLLSLGFEVRTGIGGHGVIGVLRGGDGPTIAFRADMDAVRSGTTDPVDFASEEGVCGLGPRNRPPFSGKGGLD